jgi:hypothetical protein
MATFQPVDELAKYLGNKEIDLDSDVFKAMLTDTAPTKAGSLVKTDFTEISATGGYTTGGQTLTGVTWAETGAGTGIWQWTFADPSWTATGADIPTHRYLVVYDDTHASKVVIGYIDRGSSAVITNGNTRLWDIGANGAFRLTVS